MDGVNNYTMRPRANAMTRSEAQEAQAAARRAKEKPKQPPQLETIAANNVACLTRGRPLDELEIAETQRQAIRNSPQGRLDYQSGQRPSRSGAASSSGTCSLPGASADGQGVPEGVTSATDAYYQGWDTQARFFQHGKGANIFDKHGEITTSQNQRRFTFSDGSYVDVKTHEPALTTSDDSNFMVASAFFGGSFAGVGGPLAAAIADKSRPYDAAWQGYTADYYNVDGTKYGTQHFYGWTKSSDAFHAVSVDGEYDPSAFPNFADRPEDYSWYGWKTGDAPLRDET
ncbi:hypothetical protein [Ensifer sp. SL37]|uniref:hypothetical protein n=1 Tax=Ensifer sp. SL37 TaxID=2995137 RepID=UPI0022757F94|nr:hypothetical protein [Ensifer sp. SL37]MCY1740551.1 hypothetical protein [Ensifer sp. SL37]